MSKTCPKCPCGVVVGLFLDGEEYKCPICLMKERDNLRRQLAERDTELSAWHKTFGTTQLTHATAELTRLRAIVDKLPEYCERVLAMCDEIDESRATSAAAEAAREKK